MSNDFSTAAKSLKKLLNRPLQENKKRAKYTQDIEEIEDKYNNKEIDEQRRSEEIWKTIRNSEPVKTSTSLAPLRQNVFDPERLKIIPHSFEEQQESALILEDVKRGFSTGDEAIERLSNAGIEVTYNGDDTSFDVDQVIGEIMRTPSSQRAPRFGDNSKEWNMLASTTEMVRLLEMRKDVDNFLKGLIKDDWLTLNGAVSDMDEVWRRIIDEYITIYKSVNDLNTIEATGLDALRSQRRSAQEAAMGATIAFSGIRSNAITFS